MKVWMFVSNNCQHDARVLKEATTLAEAGLLMVSSNLPALKEIVDGYGPGCTFDPEEPESIVAAINLILADEQRYDTMKKDALEPARISNWQNESRKLLEIYRRLSHRSDDRTA